MYINTLSTVCHFRIFKKESVSIIATEHVMKEIIGYVGCCCSTVMLNCKLLYVPNKIKQPTTTICPQTQVVIHYILTAYGNTLDKISDVKILPDTCFTNDVNFQPECNLAA